ncbi:hypothetical protein G6F63_013713 [Rhizopus arrhizus]|nr:hypothetical protein G6F63_013713 [Rhizopus arrhizus]
MLVARQSLPGYVLGIEPMPGERLELLTFRPVPSTGYRAIGSTTLVLSGVRKRRKAIEARRFGGQPRNGTARPAFQQRGPRHDLRVSQPERRRRQDHARHPYRRRAGDARPACRAAGRRPAGFFTGLDATTQPARLASAVQRRGPRTRNAASGSARTRQAGRSRRHRRPAAHRRPRALRATRGRARADPGAAQPLRPVGQCRDGRTDP